MNLNRPESTEPGKVTKWRAGPRNTLGGFFVLGLLCGALPGWSAEIAGITEPYRDVTLSASVAGAISEHHFQEGETVLAGQPVVELDHRLEELEVARRQALLDHTTAVLERTEELAAKTRSVSREELDKNRAEQRVAQAELDFAREQLRRRQITAPFDGVIADLFGLEAGESCQPQMPLVRIVDTRKCWLVVHVEVGLVPRLHLGQKLRVGGGKETGSRPIPAEVKFIAPVADPASGLVKVKVLFDNSESHLVAGDLATLILADD